MFFAQRFEQTVDHVEIWHSNAENIWGLSPNFFIFPLWLNGVSGDLVLVLLISSHGLSAEEVFPLLVLIFKQKLWPFRVVSVLST